MTSDQPAIEVRGDDPPGGSIVRIVDAGMMQGIVGSLAYCRGDGWFMILDQNCTMWEMVELHYWTSEWRYSTAQPGMTEIRSGLAVVLDAELQDHADDIADAIHRFIYVLRPPLLP